MRQRSSARSWALRAPLALLALVLGATALKANGRSAAEVMLSDGVVWLATAARGEVTQLNAEGEVTARVTVASPGAPLELAQAGADALVLNRATGEVGVVDGAALDYGPTTVFGGNGADTVLIANGGQPYVLDAAAGRVRALNPDTVAVAGEATLSPPLTASAVDSSGVLWAAVQATGEVASVSGDGRHTRRQVADRQGDAPIVVALADDRPYVVNPLTSEIRALGEDGGLGAPLCPNLEADELLGAAVTGTEPGEHPRLFALVAKRAQLLSIDLKSRSCTRLTIGPAGDDFGEPTTAGGAVFIPDVTRGHVVVIDAATNVITRNAPVVRQGEPFELVRDEGVVWYNSLSGPEAGVINPDGSVERSEKYKDQARPAFGTRTGAAGAVGPGAEAGGGEPLSTSGTTRDGRGNAQGTGGGTADGAGAAGGGAGSGGAGAGGGRGPQDSEDEPPAPARPPDVVRGDGGSGGAGAAVASIVLPPAEPGGGDASASGAQGGGRPAPAPVKPAAEPPPPPPPAPPPPDAGLLANFTFTASEVEVGDEVTFYDASSGSVGAWTWDFGDGGSATGPVVAHKWAKAGSFTVTLTVSNSNASDRNSTSITVTPAETPRRPTANFVFSPGSAEVDEEVTFTDTSTGRPTTLTWDFGDGATATGPKVTHRWKRPGPMRVTLVAANDVGADRATTSVVIVDKVVAPKASFTVSASPLVVGQAVTFVDTSSGQPTNPVWDFGDGSPPAAGPRVTHAFATAQPYTVRLTVRNAKGEDSTERVLSVQAPAERPVARFTVSAPTAEVGQRVEFESVSLNNPTELQWSFGDGASAVGPRAAHVWNAPGSFTVTLVARNQAGASTAQTTLRIAPATPPTAPKADFDRNPADVAPLGAPVSFIDRSTGVITSWTWTFGAPTSVSTERNPVRTFSTPGAHQVTLQVRGPGGVDSVTKTVRVADGSVRPVAAFSFSPPAPVVGDRVLFRDESQNSPATFSWNFGDNSPLDTTRNPTHVFRSPGIYRVTLTVANASGESTRTNDVTVTASQRQAPTAEFQFSPGSPSAGDLVTFTDVTDGAVTTPIWTFPGGRVVASPASQRSVQHTFNDVGDQQVSMKVCWVEEPTNCNERTKTVSVRAPSQKPTASFEMSGAVLDQRTVLLGKPVSFTDTSTGAAITSRRWLIDGAPTSTAQKVDHPGFTQPGDVEVELTVANATGADTVRRTIRVINAVKPTAQFSFAPSTPAVDDPVAFNGRLSESPTSFVTAWRWDFGDGATATIAQPTHRFAAPGLYPVRLTVTNQWGADTITHVVTVVPTFAVRVTNGAGSVVTSPFSGVVGEAFGFEVTGAAATAVVSWTFGDGVTVAGLTARHTWSAAGAFDVRVTVTVNGAAATQTLRAVISPPPAPPASDSSAGGGPGAAAELPAG